jgi:hypothetical protein
MDLIELVRPTKEKICSFIVLVIGLNFFPGILKFVITVFFARTLGPKEYAEFLVFKSTNVLFILTATIVYLVWAYFVISVIVKINQKKAL